jgi:hypothetical protein
MTKQRTGKADPAEIEPTELGPRHPNAEPVEAEPVEAAADPRIADPEPPSPEVVAILGDAAKPTGMLRMAVIGSTAHLQFEWAVDGRATWTDVPHVTVEPPIIAAIMPATPPSP